MDLSIYLHLRPSGLWRKLHAFSHVLTRLAMYIGAILYEGVPGEHPTDLSYWRGRLLTLTP